jgi:ribonuclease G
MPTGKYSGVSRKIESADERNRLKSVMKRIRPEGMATVVRTAASGVSEAELIADLGVLIRMWHGILEMYKRAASPSLLHKDMNLVYKAARDFITADVSRVLIDDEEEYRKIRDFLQLLGPQYISRLEYYNSGRQLFDDYKITEELQKLMKPKINLPSGASIVIESTEALTVIDVNSGKFTGGRNLEDTILKTNIEAAEEIARQVRLRDIGGIIVVDFIDMNSDASRDKVVKTMEDHLRRDRTRATIQSFSNLGLLEFTRKRIGRDLGAQLRGTCPTCVGMGSVMSSQSVAIETFRRIRSDTRNGVAGDVVVHVAPTVALQMEFWYEEECEELARAIQHPIHVRVDPMIHPEKARVEIVNGFKELKPHAVRVGDEHEIELLAGRLPNPTSAAGVVEGRIVEIENAVNNAGNFVRIRILDVDDDQDSVLAELVTADAKPRRRGARRVKPTAANRRGSCASWPKTPRDNLLPGPRSASRRSPKRKKPKTRRCGPSASAKPSPTRSSSPKAPCSTSPVTGTRGASVAAGAAAADAGTMRPSPRRCPRRRSRQPRPRQPRWKLRFPRHPASIAAVAVGAAEEAEARVERRAFRCRIATSFKSLRTVSRMRPERRLPPNHPARSRR